jgi:hypothetical protein
MPRVIFTAWSPAFIDGREAWGEVVRGIRRTFDDPALGAPALAVAALVLLVIWVNLRIARWLLTGHARKAPPPPPPPPGSQRPASG